MIDTHSHILPNLDDGPQTMAGTIQTAKTAVQEGVEIIVATPHCLNGVYKVNNKDILTSCNTLNSAITEMALPLTVLPGAEVRVTHNIIELYDAGHLLTFNDANSHILLELPDMILKPLLNMVIGQFLDRGVTPVIAHPERNPMILNSPVLINELMVNGAKMQITAGSLCGDFGRQIMHFSKQMVIDDQVFCIGSDIHPGRKYRMKKVHKIICKLKDKQTALSLTKGNPQKLLNCVNNKGNNPHALALKDEIMDIVCAGHGTCS